MYLFYCLVFLACAYQSTALEKHRPQVHNPWIYKIDDYTVVAYHARTRDPSNRILQLMRTYCEEATSRLTYMNPMRFMYEESPYYEMGYIIGEIIERYRRVLEHAQKCVKFKYYTLMDILKHVEYMQKLSFEIYHLVRMLHEIPRKYRKEEEFLDIEKIAGPDLLYGKGHDGKGAKFEVKTNQQKQAMKETMKRLLELQRNQAKERRRQKKKYDKIRQDFMMGLSKDMKVNRTKVKPWPLYDYGWEIPIDRW